MKKYEIYLPLKYNDGREIEAEKIKQIREELIAVFGALTCTDGYRHAPPPPILRKCGTFTRQLLSSLALLFSARGPDKIGSRSFLQELRRNLHGSDLAVIVAEHLRKSLQTSLCSHSHGNLRPLGPASIDWFTLN
jgi:hypothetical protein